MNRKIIIILFSIVLICIIAVFGLLFYSHTDLSGTPYSEISTYIEENPHKKVSFQVEISGGTEPLLVDEQTDAITLTEPEQIAGLIEQAAFLPPNLEIQLALVPTYRQLTDLLRIFPDAGIDVQTFSVNGAVYSADCTELDLSGITHDDTPQAIQLLQILPSLTTVELTDENGESQLPLDDVLLLQETFPHVTFHYTFTLFDQTVSTDMDALYYTEVNIGDSGLDEFRRIMPIMKNLTYLRLDTCETSNEATAQLREELKDRCKVVWRVFFGQNDALTDTYKILATWNLDTQEAADLKYFNEVKYIDLGHNTFTTLDFMAYLPDVEMVILALDRLEDISGIANCTKIEYLEIFSNTGLTNEDMQYLSGLTNLKYLNMSNLPKVTDLSFTDNLPQLRWLYCTMSYISESEIQRVTALHPDCKVVFRYGSGNPTGYGWRYLGDDKSVKNSLYTLVCARFNYDVWDVSMGEKGYLREEITFESLGLTPP